MVSKITKSLIAIAVAIIVPAIVVKVIACFMLTSLRGWTVKERTYVSVIQIPKAAIQATLASKLYLASKSYNIEEYL